ncbi:hypothetical protein GALMADRAFT_241903 [Galerina marginata CBS 339.88]|uniref:Uncharacterized protein n=1 Tax=Galerina marginata (strain CBS 339.88) TaxID=685588 RepID=A0A067TIS3_GALM3|nr:hypothetical protein GALMADRAFT_241903 [Galerina marginata CBS 339.88]
MIYSRKAPLNFMSFARASAGRIGRSYWLSRGSGSGMISRMRLFSNSTETRGSVEEKKPFVYYLGLTNPVLTLDPEKFTAVGQQPINLSSKLWACFQPSPGRVSLSYPSGEPGANFPPNSFGYLYYKKPADGQPNYSGSVRFRVLPTPISTFEQGSDLQTPDGKPWRVLLYSIAQFRNYKRTPDYTEPSRIRVHHKTAAGGRGTRILLAGASTYGRHCSLFTRIQSPPTNVEH